MRAPGRLWILCWPAALAVGGLIIDMKEMGVGLAAAVLIDATLVRAVLLPATMKLLGEANWYLPRWLEWLPRLEREPPEAEPKRAPEAVPLPAQG